ncbi:MAG: hypothetical protein JJ975_12335 [Bacteroidia bacterium]|nr:hypothetical protein [Bacteroidia bacterium]
MRSALQRILLCATLLVLASLFNEVMAQCPMCRSAVESAMQNEGNTVGLGLNKGILYLLATPYVLVASVGVAWYRKNRKAKHG